MKSRSPGIGMKRSAHCAQSGVEVDGTSPAPPQSVDRKMCSNDALAYWKEAKETLGEHNEEYEQLLEAVQEFAAKKIDLATMVKKVKVVLADHQELVLGFNAFLPNHYQITDKKEENTEPCRENGDNEEDGHSLTSSGYRNKMSPNDALAYWQAAKETLGEQNEKYEQIMQAVRDFAAKKIDLDTMVKKVKVLLAGHRELILGFNTFLPKEHQITEEEEEHECGSCEQSIEDNAYRIVCYTCHKRFHCKCMHYTHSQAKNTEKYKCQSCHDTFCGICRELYTNDKLWIQCYYCHKGFHRKCVQLSEDRADRIECYRCPWCSGHRSYV